MRKPLSTIQRRSSRLLEKGFVKPAMHLNYKKFGLRRGLLQFTCKGTNLREAAEKIGKIKGVEAVGGYLGSVEIIANVVYADSAEVIEIIAEAQKLGIIYDVKWSEEIHSLPT
jgi:DNA-binding Lrp family transcriptional regulator